MRIVLVDDSPRFLRLLERALAAEPRLRVVGRARSGAEALAQVARLQPDLVLMDLALPGMNGIEATRRLKAQGGAPQVILVTLYDTPQHRAAAEAAGVDHYLCKATLHTDFWPLLNELLS
jgi:two-component system invasion response regulator UvrY